MKKVVKAIIKRIINYFGYEIAKSTVPKSHKSIQFHKSFDYNSLRVNFEVLDYIAFCKKTSVDINLFVADLWGRHLKVIQGHFLEENTDMFQDPIVRFAIFLSINSEYQNIQIPYLERKYENTELKRLLVEDHVLKPDITNNKYKTSETLTSHLTHLTLFKEHAGVDPFKFKTTFEFGGGYGSMCRLLYRVSKERTYIITDLPLMLFLQSYYLKNILGEEMVNFVGDDKFENIKMNKINLVPIFFKDTLSGIRDKLSVDLFISTWSLSEANRVTQCYIRDLDFMNAKYILHGYYGKKNEKLPYTEELDIFSKYTRIYHEPAFYDKRKLQKYLFLRKT